MATRQRYTRNIIFLVGPTAVGKTEVSIKLARLINAEIISCDSMQVYKGMDIISQKPTGAQQKQIVHHMIGIISPAKNFNVSDYRNRVLKIIKKIHKKNRIPLFVGGTGLYMKALIDGLFPSPKADFKLRERLSKETGLYKKLEKVDPRTAEVIHPNDTRRIIRALEIYYKTNATMSQLKKGTKGLSQNYGIRIFCLNRNREELYGRINKRVDRMFNSGLINEARRLKNKKISLSASQILGLKEIFAYLDKKCTKDETKELLRKNQRHFAKRQLSWFRNDPRVIWVDIENNESAEKTAKRINEII